jgi:hypothetical protein
MRSVLRKSFTTARASLVGLGVLISSACSDAAGPEPKPGGNIRLITLETFEGSGQAVHPDAAVTPTTWGGSTVQLFATPYPYGDASKEDPSLYSMQSAVDWPVPRNVSNPIARPTTGYLSDPDQVFNPETGELWLYYRAVTSENEILLLRGGRPTVWSTPQLVVRGANHTIVSPTVVRRSAGDWLMWSVNSGTTGCSSLSTTVELRRSVDGITWSQPETTDLAEETVFAWHIDVEWIPSAGEFWAVFNVKVPGSCTTSALHFARSTDGLHWQISPGPVLARGAIPAFADIVYRASLLYDQALDTVTLWYSGARYDQSRYVWRIATESMTAATFFNRLASQAAITTPAVTNAPPLTDADAP